MSRLSDKKTSVKGSIAALQTVLERYPVLLTTNEDATETSLDFTLNLLTLFGVDEEKILDWLCGLLAEDKNGNGLLFTIELAVKTAILSTFKETYTCSINPTLPDDIMMSFSPDTGWWRGSGIKIPISEIDAFGLLNKTPTDRRTCIFYFDSDPDNGYNPSNVYTSMDFNAFLWYVINRGNFWADSQKLKCVWDNRTFYYKPFSKNDCLNGTAMSDPDSLKKRFFDTDTKNSPMMMVKGLGPKAEILGCEYIDSPSSIIVYLNAGRYQKTSLTGMSNRTIFEFNADYIYSLKLFDTRAIIAQIINAVLGIASSIKINLSVEQIALGEKVKSIVEKVITLEDNETETTLDCYYTFSNDEYNTMLENAKLKYDGLFPSGNENSDFINVDADAIMDEIYKIGSSEDLHETKMAIKNTFQNVADILTSTPETNPKFKIDFNKNIIKKFIKELVSQLCMQILSPKIMLLYAINERIMNPTESEEEQTFSAMIIAFMEKFQNLLVSIIKKIGDIILQQLFDFLIGQIKPLITLLIQKLLLETLYYYKILIEDLIRNCTIDFTPRFTGQPLEIDQITHADIIPEATLPPEEGCRQP